MPDAPYLQYLRVQALALVDQTELELEPGFAAITGETGAGKSLLLGALRLLAGARADKSIIHAEASECVVEAIVSLTDSKPIDSVLDELGLPACEDGALVLRRSVPRAAKTARIHINGAVTTLASLQRMSALWIDFHGAGESQSLLNEKRQLILLDRYAQTEPLLERYRTLYQQWRAALAEREDLSQAHRLSPEEQAFYRSQLNSIDALALSPESIEALEHDYARGQHAHELIELSNRLSGSLAEGEASIAGQLSEPLQDAQRMATLDPDSQGVAQRLEGLILECQDLAVEYATLGNQVDLDAEAAVALEQRMNQWLELKHKYGDSVEAVLTKRDEFAQKLAQQGDIEGHIKRLQSRIDQLEKKLRAKATELRQQREQGANQLADACQPLLTTLGFKRAHLHIALVPESRLTEHGDSRCVFEFAPNPGQDPLPLSKIASSGEAARVLLALKTVLAGCDQTPVLVFDEVDANVGGEVGGYVGEQLARLAQGHHVFCVTHLPQVAAQANQHYCITKTQTQQTTQINIAALHSNQSQRIAELARMLGDRHSASAIQHATSLLASR